eukprot:365072-Chlamydomonas_euryale.AAC.6
MAAVPYMHAAAACMHGSHLRMHGSSAVHAWRQRRTFVSRQLHHACIPVCVWLMHGDLGFCSSLGHACCAGTNACFGLCVLACAAVPVRVGLCSWACAAVPVQLCKYSWACVAGPVRFGF